MGFIPQVILLCLRQNIEKIKAKLVGNFVIFSLYYGVIYQPYAFTAVDDGQINLTPNDQAYRAAKEAMNGYDPSYGALYYYNPATATSNWIFSRKTTVVIGRHVFAI